MRHNARIACTRTDFFSHAQQGIENTSTLRNLVRPGPVMLNGNMRLAIRLGYAAGTYDSTL